jgi:hypothetical protein
LHESVVQVIPSPHGEPLPTHDPEALQVSVAVQKRPSEHAVPDGRGDQEVWLSDVRHAWHPFPGFTVPSA